MIGSELTHMALRFMHHLGAFTNKDEQAIGPLVGNGTSNAEVDDRGEIADRIECLPVQSDEHGPRAVVFKYLHNFDEASLGMNLRKVSPDADVQNGGPFSGIVRVVAVFQIPTGEWWQTTGSGVIIDDHHVMTVGHNIWSSQGGLALSISIHRDGRADHNDSDKRCVEAGAVHYRWAQACAKANGPEYDRTYWINDFAILRVSKPFPKGTQPMEYRKTPTKTTSAKIYGFPTDMPKDTKGKWLAYLCYSQGRVTYVPTSSLLDHDGDTEPGSSGGPVVDSSGRVIALHRGCDWVVVPYHHPLINKAVALLTKGNDPEKFIQAINFPAGKGPTKGQEVRKGNVFRVGDCVATYYDWN
ncbi:trypsin-like cysteine/serine peptidase domain-containing protein [Daldinia decipiens]|uniref:trypsin-like cysteine/serine peptidase domain-containing protein n=1 Tax=Daldinia decipiens TaxID=326647 RepID=UPI0020C1F49A|nr:trypsin-like cysteine/serine peptidase domain-containing protein [Daldinia decipiens]KAI1662126.1 trypsin-like cysteine/serine peptidase domain-containing protein [Daldinia decipiens]